MPIAEVGDINLYYETHGKGKPLVLIMGYTLRGDHWRDMQNKLAREYRVIVFDNRGTGRSDKPEMPYTASMMAGDVAGLLDVLDIGAANVLGYSMGGMIAQEFVLNYPNRANSVMLGATFYGGPKSVLPSPEAMAFFLNPEIDKLSAEDIARGLVPMLWNTEFVQNNPAVIERFVATCCKYPTPPQAVKSHQSVLMTFNSYDRLPNIKIPTLVITGTEDRSMPYENSKLLASRIPNAELATIENEGHGI
ncbi:MAG: alpha/beta hydrolase, partial [Dehalococcoidia bacterium]|nr:alpha/beta hydrolase [Dehalococcoidia bacterium]